MSFAIFKDPKICELVDRYSECKDLVAVAGAGASVEAGLPTWEELVERSLARAAKASKLGLKKDALRAWVEEIIASESMLGGLATAEALSRNRLATWLPDLLYGKNGAAGYRPGPITRQLAYLKEAFGRDLDLITTNYDDLLEVALRSREGITVPIIPYTGPPDDPPTGQHIKVIHPHGYLGRDKSQGKIILTEKDYAELQRGSGNWQEATVGGKILERTCLFVGASMTDSNLLRYIYYYAHPGKTEHRHTVLIVREAEDHLSLDVQKAREQASELRWSERGVASFFLDHFADVAYLIHEIAYRREIGATKYQPLNIRAGRWIAAAEQNLICPSDVARFRENQTALNEVLTRALTEACNAVEATGLKTSHDDLAMALWLFSQDGTELTCWATTDRLYHDPATIRPIPINPHSRWVSVKTVCRGRDYIGRPAGMESRWRYVLGLPLHIRPSGEGTLPIGCLTVTSMLEDNETILGHTTPPDVQSEFKRTVRKLVASALEALVP